MLDTAVNRERVQKWRDKLFTKGFKPVTVYLNNETLEMLASLRRDLHARKKTSKIITLAIQDLYKKVVNDHNN